MSWFQGIAAGGYSLGVQAEPREAVREMAKGRLILAAGGSVEVAKAIVLPL